MARWRAMLMAAVLAMPGAVPQALAWGPDGHRIVAEIALANVRPQTAARIHALLGAQAQLGTPACPIASLDDASNWPDCLRSEPARWAYTFSWHYQDEPVCGRFDVAAQCPGGNCITAQIGRMRRILADPRQGDGRRLAALAFLAHFIGDIHQPLHVADRHDRGGNLVTLRDAPARLAGDGTRRVSLHRYWDSLPQWVVNDADHPLVRVYSRAERSRIATGEVADWARESYDLARSLAYAQAFHHDPCTGQAPGVVALDAADMRADLPVVRRRLVQAGLRLARVLDAALGS